MRIAFAAAIVIGAVLAGPVAAIPPPDLPIAERAAVAAVLDGDTIALKDGRIVRLAAIMAPKQGQAPTARRDALAAASRDALATLVLGRSVGLAPVAATPDRYGRMRAHVVGEDGEWIQAALVVQGFARVATTPDARAGAAPLLTIEARARAAGRGLWAHRAFRVIPVEAASRAVGSFQIVEGRVRSAERRGGRVWLNFGTDWREDFSVLIAPSPRRLFVEAGLDPAGLAGTMIRVRGWIASRNGPLIEATHPEQIEVIE